MNGRCFVSNKVCVLAKKKGQKKRGWTEIWRVRVGDEVLTHKGRFRKVISII